MDTYVCIFFSFQLLIYLILRARMCLMHSRLFVDFSGCYNFCDFGVLQVLHLTFPHGLLLSTSSENCILLFSNTIHFFIQQENNLRGKRLYDDICSYIPNSSPAKSRVLKAEYNFLTGILGPELFRGRLFICDNEPVQIKQTEQIKYGRAINFKIIHTGNQVLRLIREEYRVHCPRNGAVKGRSRSLDVHSCVINAT